MTHVLWVIRHVEFDGDTNFYIWHKVRASSGQKRSNFENHFLNMPILSSFVSGFQKCHLFCRTVIRNSKNLVSKKVTSLPLLGFWAIEQPKIQILV